MNDKHVATTSNHRLTVRMRSVTSFDVFDTCLTRKVAAPSYVFCQVAERVARTLFGRTATPSEVEDFTAARIVADSAARRATGLEEIKLNEIWNALEKLLGWPGVKDLWQAELDAEEETLVGVKAVRARVATARTEKKRIVFTSDTYLPASFIQAQLAKHGFYQPGDGLYVSSEVGKRKDRGELFRHLLQQENVRALDVFHVGDNPVSDLAQPMGLGIKAELLQAAELIRAESTLLKIAGVNHRPLAEFAGAARAFRVAAESTAPQGCIDLVADFVGPFMLGFVAWVLSRAQADGIKRLYFLSRDAQLAHKVAVELAPHFGNIDCRYLHISRHALYLPSIQEISEVSMPWMRRYWEMPRLDRLLQKVELAYRDVESIWQPVAGTQGGEYILASPADWERFWLSLNTEPAKSHLDNLIQSRRDAARQYYRQMGLYDAVRWGVVDIGWFFTSQRSLRSVLGLEAQPNFVNGYYLGARIGRCSRAETGPVTSLFYELPPDVPEECAERIIFNSLNILENVTGCSDHARVNNYEIINGVAQVVLQSDRTSQAHRVLVPQIQDLSAMFMKRNVQLIHLLRDENTVRGLLATSLRELFEHPRPQVASALSPIQFGLDHDNREMQCLVKSFTVQEALCRFIPFPLHRQPRNSAHQSWEAGCVASSPSTVRKLIKAHRELSRLFHLFRRK